MYEDPLGDKKMNSKLLDKIVPPNSTSIEVDDDKISGYNSIDIGSNGNSFYYRFKRMASLRSES